MLKPKCLEGMRVLELSQFISAPYTCQTLADFGADVIKIELPGEGRGDIARKYDPMYKDMSLYFASYNRNKKFVTLNLKSEEGKKLFLDLVRESDVVVENFRPGVMDKMGVGYDVLKKTNPAIILASLSGFGQEGPMRNRQALDMSIQALCGIMDITGPEDGPPTKVGPVLVDFIGGIYLLVGILAAYSCCQRTGMGQHIDIALYDAMFVLMENYPAIYRMTGEVPRRVGNGRPFSSPTNTFKAKDGKWIQISGTAEMHFEKLITMVGHPEYIGLPNTIGAENRRKNANKMLEDAIQEWAGTVTAQEAADALDQIGVPNAVVKTAKEVFDDPQIAYRNMLICPEDSVLDDIPTVGNPIKLSATPAEFHRSAKPSGFDTDSVLQTLLGMSAEAVAELREKNIV